MERWRGSGAVGSAVWGQGRRVEVSNDVRNVAGFGGFCYDGGCAGRGGEASSDDFGGHPAGAEGGAGGGDVGAEGVNVGDHADGLGVWEFAWVLVVQCFDVGHKEEVVCVDHSGGDGGEGVVVAEFDFGDGEGVVLVDDGYHTERKRLGQCVLCV